MYKSLSQNYVLRCIEKYPVVRYWWKRLPLVSAIHTWFLRWGLIQSIKKSCRQFLLSHFTPNLSIFCTTYVLFTTFTHSVRFLTFFYQSKISACHFQSRNWNNYSSEWKKNLIRYYFMLTINLFFSSIKVPLKSGWNNRHKDKHWRNSSRV